MKKNRLVVHGMLAVVLALVMAQAVYAAGEDAEDFGAKAKVAKTFTVAAEGDLRAAIEAIKKGGKNKNYVISIPGNIDITDGISFDSFQGKVSLRGTGTITLTDPSKEFVLNVRANQMIILRGPTLKASGAKEEVRTVEIYEGTFVMRSGTIDANNQERVVDVARGGRFEMYGGTITGTKAEYNAVNAKGIFIMYGGNISNNKSTAVWADGTFTMTGGSISNNSGAGVEVTGAFTMTGGSISGNAVGVLLYEGTTVNINAPAAKASISGNTEGQVNVVGGAFKVDGVDTKSY